MKFIIYKYCTAIKKWVWFMNKIRMKVEFLIHVDLPCRYFIYDTYEFLKGSFCEFMWRYSITKHIENNWLYKIKEFPFN